MGMYRLLALLFLSGGLTAQTLMLDPTANQLPRKSWEESHRWLQTDDIDGRFRIEFPGELEHRADTVGTAVGSQVYHTYFYKVPEIERAENLIYVLSYVDYPEGSLHQDSTDLLAEFLSSTEAAAAEALSGEVVYAVDRPVEGYPGRLWRIDYKEGEAVARTLAFVIGNRYYELKTFALTRSGLSDASDTFFRSFRYLGDARG